MRLRVVSVAFFIASAAVAVTWLTVLPSLMRMLDLVRRGAPPTGPALETEAIRSLLPFLLAADILTVVGIAALILWLTVARPLHQLEEVVAGIDSTSPTLPVSSTGGPLLARLETALRRMTAALSEEQATTHRQLAELRAANEQLGQMQAELVAQERLATVGRLAAGVAHEVGNPLSGIMGYLSLLRMKADDAQLQDFVERVEAEVQRIDRIVHGLLDLGRPPQLEPQPVQVANLVRTCARLVSSGAELRNVKLDVAVPEDLVVRADPGPLSQILINLLINAGQAMGGEGSMRVGGRVEGDATELWVEDSGPGIPPEALPRLFEPFFTTKAAGKGTGLGLAVSQRLASAMGGRLLASNRSEGGARFVVQLPSA